MRRGAAQAPGTPTQIGAAMKKAGPRPALIWYGPDQKLWRTPAAIELALRLATPKYDRLPLSTVV